MLLLVFTFFWGGVLIWKKRVFDCVCVCVSRSMRRGRGFSEKGREGRRAFGRMDDVVVCGCVVCSCACSSSHLRLLLVGGDPARQAQVTDLFVCFGVDVFWGRSGWGDKRGSYIQNQNHTDNTKHTHVYVCIYPHMDIHANAYAGGGGESTDLEIAVGVEEEVGGLQIPVQDVGRVHVLEGAQHLVFGC